MSSCCAADLCTNASFDSLVSAGVGVKLFLWVIMPFHDWKRGRHSGAEGTPELTHSSLEAVLTQGVVVTSKLVRVLIVPPRTYANTAASTSTRRCMEPVSPTN